MELRRIIDLVENDFAFLNRMGLRAEILEPCRVKLKLPLAGNENHMGTVWAGALFTLAELPGGVLIYTTFEDNPFVPLVKEMNIKFLKPARTDVEIEMSMDSREAARLAREARETGHVDFTLEGEVKDTQGQVVAATTGYYRMQKMKG
ncbi:MAG: DUF4442 domain-containing protein [Desulfobacterales bacterium]|nr:DUF4442 domain-containing protein [Desulfobacterales bacterium]